MSRIKSTIRNPQSEIRKAATLVELMIAMAVMVVVFAAVVPLLRGIHNTWDTRQGSMDLTQNGRLLIDHLYKHLAAAKKVIAVSGSAVTSGYIQFQGSDDLTYRYDISGTNYVEFGEVGSLADLAGPVSSLKFACYAEDDLATPITDGNDIRLVKIQTTLTNASPMGPDKTWTTSVELRCDLVPAQALVGWWRFDEASGLTALDSSSYGYNGTLTNMTGSERIAGVLNRGLSFDGFNDHVVLPIGSVIGSCDSITVATWANFSNVGWQWQRIFDFGSNTTFNMFLTPNNADTGVLRFAITKAGRPSEIRVDAPTILPTGWHHVAVTIDGPTKTIKLYQDGVVKDTHATTVLPSDLGTTSKNYLGRSQYPDPYYDGALDDFRIYNYVLTSAQIGDLFAVGDMVQHLPLDETQTSGGVTTTPDNAGIHDGTLVNGPTLTTGTWGGALNFDGTNDYVSSSRTIDYDMTITAWIKTTSTAVGPFSNPNVWWDGEGIVDADKGGQCNDFGCSNNQGKFAFGTGRTGVVSINILSTTTINDGNWHHVAATRKGSNGQMKVYVDGVLEATKTGYTGYLNDATAMRIGGILDQGGTPNPDPQRLFLGRIDDVRIYGRILTLEQIALLLE